jgi:hypothetical protein
LLAHVPKQLITFFQANSPWFRDSYAPLGATWISETAGYASNGRNTSNSRETSATAGDGKAAHRYYSNINSSIDVVSS